MQGTTPCLWFDRQAEEAANFYVSVFPDSRILDAHTLWQGRAPAGRHGADGALHARRPGVRRAQRRSAFHVLAPAISFVVNCASQQEVDAFWDKLSARPEHEQCGWLQDRYGVSWQIVPTVLPRMLATPDPARSQRAFEAAEAEGEKP